MSHIPKATATDHQHHRVAPIPDLSQPPTDPDALQVHLSLDQPPGEVVVAWRNLYADDPDLFADPGACIDQCNEYLQDTIGACWACGAAVASRDEATCAIHRGDGS